MDWVTVTISPMRNSTATMSTALTPIAFANSLTVTPGTTSTGPSTAALTASF